MVNWREKALKLFPELNAAILEAEDPMALWIHINFAFIEAYEEPRNDDLIKRVYEFESWCIDQEPVEDAANDLPTCVVLGFWKHLPTHPATRKDMARWFSPKEILVNSDAFSYFLSAGNFEALLEEMEHSGLNMEREPSYLPADA